MVFLYVLKMFIAIEKMQVYTFSCLFQVGDFGSQFNKLSTLPYPATKLRENKPLCAYLGLCFVNKKPIFEINESLIN